MRAAALAASLLVSSLARADGDGDCRSLLTSYDQAVRELKTYRSDLSLDPNDADMRTLAILEHEVDWRKPRVEPCHAELADERERATLRAAQDAKDRKAKAEEALRLAEERVEQGKLENATKKSRRLVLSALLCERRSSRGARARLQSAAIRKRMHKFNVSALGCQDHGIVALRMCLSGEIDCDGMAVDTLYSAVETEIEGEVDEALRDALTD
ncbi:MAG: hypothetical protein ABI445_24240 [Polyangia bacterium]